MIKGGCANHHPEAPPLPPSAPTARLQISAVFLNRVERSTGNLTTMSSKPRAFITLDGLRGVAALPIVYLHTMLLFGPTLLVAHAYLAVDFFFTLSGFVMTYVYQEKLDTGLPSGRFLLIRIYRLYPLYALGLLLGFAYQALQGAYGKVHLAPGVMAALLALGLIFLPILPRPFLSTGPAALYPFDVPAWSLFYELVANLVHAVFLRRKALRVVASLALVFSLGLFFLAIHLGNIDIGTDRPHYLAGLCRVLFAYPLGIVLYRVWDSGRGRIILHPAATAFILLAVLILPVPARLMGMYDWLAVTFCFPVLILAGASCQPTGLWIALCRWFGAISYPLYVLHVPLFQFFEQVWNRLLRHRVQQDAPWSGFIFFALLLPTVYWVGQRYDPEARKMLKHHARKFGSAAAFLLRRG